MGTGSSTWQPNQPQMLDNPSSCKKKRAMATQSFGLVLSLLLLSCEGFAGERTPEHDGWRLVWHDEFNGRNLSAKKWNVLTREQSKHNELQYYLPDEVYLEKGYLRLRSRARNFGSQHYTSGRVDTSGRF